MIGTMHLLVHKNEPTSESQNGQAELEEAKTNKLPAIRDNI